MPFVLHPLPSHCEGMYNSISSVKKARASKGKGLRGAMISLLPFMILPALGVTWLACSPTLLREHLVPFILYQSATFNLGVGRVITAHTTKMPFPRTNLATLPMVFGAVNAAMTHLGR